MGRRQREGEREICDHSALEGRGFYGGAIDETMRRAHGEVRTILDSVGLIVVLTRRSKSPQGSVLCPSLRPIFSFVYFLVTPRRRRERGLSSCLFYGVDVSSGRRVERLFVSKEVSLRACFMEQTSPREGEWNAFLFRKRSRFVLVLWSRRLFKEESGTRFCSACFAPVCGEGVRIYARSDILFYMRYESDQERVDGGVSGAG